VELPRAEVPVSRRAEAMRELGSGRRQLSAGKFQAAAASLRQGISLGLADPATAPMDDVVDGLLSLALAELRTGDERQARSALAQAVRLAPYLKLGRGKYPPVFLREFNRVRSRVLRGGMGALLLHGPPGSVAFIDGRKAGPVPARVSGLPYGTHYLRIETAEGVRTGRVTEVDRRSAEVTVSLPVQVEPPALARSLGAEQVAALGEYATQLGADFLLVGALGEDGTALRAGSALYSAASGSLLPLPEVQFAPDLAGGPVAALNLVDALVARLATPAAPLSLPVDLLAVPLPQPVVVPPPPAPPPAVVTAPPASAPTRGVFAKVPWWVWAGGAALVVGGVTTAGVIHAHRPVTGTVTATW